MKAKEKGMDARAFAAPKGASAPQAGRAGHDDK
jgi:hypothetical protein